MKRCLSYLLLWLLPVVALAQDIAVDITDGDGYRYVRTAGAVIYDDYFHTARFALAAVVPPDGAESYQLEATYDEGFLQLGRGDTLELVLRGGDRIYLTALADLTRADVVKRHYRDHNDYLITVRYGLDIGQLRRLYETKTTKCVLHLRGGGTVEHRIDLFQRNFSRLLTALRGRLSA